MKFVHARQPTRILAAATFSLVATAALLLGLLVPGAAASGVTPKITSEVLATLAYDLVSANGTVTSFGHAGNYGGAEHIRLAAPIVGMAPTPDGLGYWLVAQDGGVFRFGDARFFGSLGGHPHTAAHDVIALVPTDDGKGYWLCDASGVVTAFGDAPKLPSLRPAGATSPIVGFSVLRDELGAWVVNAKGIVYHLGQAHLYGSLKGTKLAYPIVGIARTMYGRGYWLADSKGKVTPFGDAISAVVRPRTLKAPVVGITPAPESLGWWAVSGTGYVIPGGVPSRGGLSKMTGALRIVGIAAARPVPPPKPGPYPSGSVGYDVNWPQCQASGSSQTATMPGPPASPAGTSAYTVAVVGVDGWAIDDNNTCLGAEARWAQAATLPNSTTHPSYQLYLFLNAPASNSTIDQSGPGGTCSTLSFSAAKFCLAYNYGYNAAIAAVAYAKSQGASAHQWWLDIENDACATGEWNDAANGEWWSCRAALNAKTVQGAIDALRHDAVSPGVYSTSVQWGAITGGYTPTGPQLPLWIAGAPWTSPPYPSSLGYTSSTALQPWCKGQYSFAGGKATLLQETPGSNNYQFDPDYAC